MGLANWIGGLFKKGEMNIPERVYVCPHCGSKKIGFLSTIGNFVEVMQDLEEPRYVKTAMCENCGYKTMSDIGDEGDSYLEPFVAKLDK